jgi:hypothetical protein
MSVWAHDECVSQFGPSESSITPHNSPFAPPAYVVGILVHSPSSRRQRACQYRCLCGDECKRLRTLDQLLVNPLAETLYVGRVDQELANIQKSQNITLESMDSGKKRRTCNTAREGRGKLFGCKPCQLVGRPDVYIRLKV